MNNVSQLIFEALWEYHQLTEKEEVISSWIDWWLLKHASLFTYCVDHRYDGSCVEGFSCACIEKNELMCFSSFYLTFDFISTAIKEEKEIYSSIQAFDKEIKLEKNDTNLLYTLFKDGERIYGRLGLTPIGLNENSHIYDIDNPVDFNNSYPSISSFKINPKVILYFMKWYIRLRPLRQNRQMLYSFYQRLDEERLTIINFNTSMS